MREVYAANKDFCTEPLAQRSAHRTRILVIFSTPFHSVSSLRRRRQFRNFGLGNFEGKVPRLSYVCVYV